MMFSNGLRERDENILFPVDFVVILYLATNRKEVEPSDSLKHI